ncbi:hypothetical protein H4R20_004588, partial [Coemansia guatemalensis]
MHNSNVDELGAFDLDSIDDCMWDDLLTDVQDLDPGPVGTSDNGDHQSITSSTGHRTSGVSEHNGHDFIVKQQNGYT